MNSLKKAIGTSKAREEEGAWIDVNDEIRVKIRRFNSRASKDAMKEFEKQYARANKKRMSPEELEELVTKVMARAIIVDWDGVVDDDGKRIEPTFENIYPIIADEEMSDFRELIANEANRRDVFAHELEQDSLGN